MKSIAAKKALSFLISSSILISGGVSVIADSSTGEEPVAETGVALTAENFPDQTFRELLKTENFDTDGDGYLSAVEIEGITELYIKNSNINSLKGIEYLTNLCELVCRGNNIASIDISANPGLITAYKDGEATTYKDGYTTYSIWNSSWFSPLRELSVNTDTVITCSSGLGWRNDSKGWWFKNADGSYPKDCMTKLGGHLYCFDKNGYMISSTWKEVDGQWYRFNRDGAAAEYWQNVNGKWYYFSYDYVMVYNYFIYVSDTAPSGKTTTKIYHFDSDGVMQTGWKNISGRWYYFDNSGAFTSGWKNVSGKWYYFAEDLVYEGDFDMVTGWFEIGGVWYYFKPSGEMAANEYCGGYWLGSSGAWTYKHKASWKQDSTGWWYGDTSGWYAKNETLTIDGRSYNFNSAGYCTNP